MSERVLRTDVEAGFDVNGAPCHVVTCETKRGNLLEYPTKFYGEAGARRAERFAAQVQNVGVVDLGKWDFIRAIYGSIAYADDGHEFQQMEREWEEDGRPMRFL